MASAEAAQVTAVSDGEGEQGKSGVKVSNGRGEKRGVGRKERDVGGERKPGDAVEAAEAKEEVGEISLRLGVIRDFDRRARRKIRPPSAAWNGSGECTK